MALHGSQSKAMSLNLSSDAKPRLKWTAELHQRFVDSVNQLGGAEKATPKSLMRTMGIHGLTLYHLKSHLQKYRLGRNHQSKPYHQNQQQVSDAEAESFFNSKQCDEESQEPHEQVNDNERTEIAQALQLQMEVQRKLHEQIEVQRHLQLRIEAQGKYLQSVLKKAQETLSGYGSCSIEVERAKAQLSQLMSMVDSGCPSSSFSVLTESDGSMLRDTTNKLLGHNGCSHESSLTSSECSGGMKEELTPTHEVDNKSVVLSLMEMHPSKKSSAENNATNRKRSRSNDDDELKLDLNSKYLNEFDSSPRMIDLNCKIAEP